MTGLIVATVTLGATTSAFNLIGNLGIRAISKMTPSYSGAILAGISSTALFILGKVTEDAVIPNNNFNKDEKRGLYVLTITLIGGATLPYLLSSLTKSTISLTASIGYAILGYTGNHFGFGVLEYFNEDKSFTDSFEEFQEAHLNMWDYLKS